ncbi:MAG: hypothetical protein HYR64_10465 [Fimbriimonas ginsengisoli]|uniref:Uncharacterized protein n=1 Tax=Fimbriimonas ginsengisoli TaxID=1005039 RepID=A0A931PXA2_FIMGI|nr:hypothetical protein [Fimbriimonas ginsengisoli]
MAQCQFCGATLAGSKPKSGGGVLIMDSSKRSFVTWKERVYVALACAVSVFGTYQMLIGLGVLPGPFTWKGGPILIGLMGGSHLVVGIGTLWQEVWAQFLMKCLAVMQAIPYGLFGLMMLGSEDAPNSVLYGSVGLIMSAVFTASVYFVLAVGE